MNTPPKQEKCPFCCLHGPDNSFTPKDHSSTCGMSRRLLSTLNDQKKEIEALKARLVAADDLVGALKAAQRTIKAMEPGWDELLDEGRAPCPNVHFQIDDAIAAYERTKPVSEGRR